MGGAPPGCGPSPRRCTTSGAPGWLAGATRAMQAHSSPMNVPTVSPLDGCEARAQAAWEHYQATGESVSTAEVLAKLQAKLDAKRQLLVNRAPRLG